MKTFILNYIDAFYNSLIKSKFLYLFIFFTAFIIRMLPELLFNYYPIGFETITWYAPSMFIFGQENLSNVFFSFLTAGPLFYLLLWVIQAFSSIHPYLILKIVGPLLYGFLAISFMIFLKRVLNFDTKLAFFSTILFVFQVASLRLSWDRFRSVLGLFFMFSSLTALKSSSSYKWPLLIIFTFLTVFSREYIAFILISTIFIYTIFENKDKFKLIVIFVSVFIGFYLIYFSRAPWWTHLTNSYTLNSYTLDLFDLMAILIICYLPLIPFVIKGFKNNNILVHILFFVTFFCCISFVICPAFYLPGYQRWAVLLVFPLTIYAVKGFERFNLLSRFYLKKFSSIFSIFLLISFAYASGVPYAILPNSWVPTDMVKSSIPQNKIDDVLKSLIWLDENAVTNSLLIVEERFYGWTLIYSERINFDINLSYYFSVSGLNPILEKNLDAGYAAIYLMSDSNSEVQNFNSVYSQNTISVFGYDSTK